MVVSASMTGKTKNIETFLERSKKDDFLKGIKKLAELGVSALSSATPVDTGKTANSWGYKIVTTKNFLKIYWTNDNIVGKNGTPVVILLQYGHGLKGGGYVQGRDFINPAIKPIFDRISEEIWKEVKK